jgi:Flp pilus assembly protein TadG
MRSRQRAQVIVWVAAMVPLLFLPLIGLTIDAGAMFNARRDLQDVADGAARAGAEQIDMARLRTDGSVVLDKDNARKAAHDYVDNTTARMPDEPRLDPPGNDPNQISVVVTRDVRPTFLRILHVQKITIRAGSRAQACSGVITNSCEP